MKVCSRCKNEKELNMFYKRKTSIDGLRSECKECLRIYCGKYKEGYKENNLKSVIVLSKKICSKCKIEKYSDEYHRKLNNKDGLSYNCKECASLDNKIYKDSNRDKNNEYNKSYYLNNKSYFSKYIKNRKKVDLLYNLKIVIRTSITNSIKKKGYTKKTKTYKILGCSTEEFKSYIENKFDSWMSWDNHGLYNGEFNYGWDLDHIIPISSAKTEDDIIKLNHHSNLQPLCSKINRDIKRNILDYKKIDT
jgi:hypothetical protein